jgi:protein-tyrosine phosphatase
MPSLAIPLISASNLRDLGGWPTEDGRRVRKGLVYRAPALANLAPEDEAVIAALGLRTVCDFRGTRERLHRPVQIAGATTISLPIEPSVGAGLSDILHTGKVSGHFRQADMMELLQEAYVDYALRNSEQYRAMFRCLLQPDGLPLLIHCTAGKDRTGFGSALLLSALGVAWAHIVEDYLATNVLWKQEIARDFFNLPGDVMQVLLGAHEPLLTAAFVALRREYGSLDAYLSGPIGLDAQARIRLADVLLEPDDAMGRQGQACV